MKDLGAVLEVNERGAGVRVSPADLEQSQMDDREVPRVRITVQWQPNGTAWLANWPRPPSSCGRHPRRRRPMARGAERPRGTRPDPTPEYRLAARSKFSSILY